MGDVKTVPSGTRLDQDEGSVRGFELEVIEGPTTGKRWRSTGAVCSVGSADTNDFVLADPTVSRFHCEVRLDADGARLRDTGSMNGTILDGVRIMDAYLRGGSVFRVGHTELRFDFASGSTRLALSEERSFGMLVGKSVPMREAFYLMQKAAGSTVTTLLEGETGTGKTAAARSIHMSSARADGPFVVVDCAAIPANLIESELFGHERGAFTGADSKRIGAFEEADGGTLFLDEVGELPPNLQPKLLGALESHEVRPLGSNTAIPVDVRVIAATNRDLRREVNDSRFREDLFYRLAVVRIEIPALRKRPADIPAIARSLLITLGAGDDRADELLTPPVVAQLTRCAWRGNVRELRNYLERCLLFDEALPIEHAGDPHPGVVDTSLSFADGKRRAIDAYERDYLTGLLEKHAGKVSAAATAAGLDRTHFYRLLRKHRLNRGS